MTFRINKPGEDAGLADYGELNFIGRAAHNPAPFLRFAATREPFLSEEAYCSQVLDLLERHWKMQSASVLISITGSAQDFDLSPRLHQTFSHGLAKAAHATNAWIVTGGTDTGVMRLVGRALASFDERVTVVGITAWGSLLEREHMEGCRGQRIEITNQKKNDRFGANLEPHHTHFLMVDDGSRADKAWGTEIKFRFALEREYARRRRVPRVLLVVQGGPGTLQSILEAVIGECPVVLVADSGGVAQALDHFLFRSNPPSVPDGKDFRAFKDLKHVERLMKIKELNDISHKVSSFVLNDSSTAQLDLYLLNAVLNDSSQCKPQHRLKLAVEWGRLDVVSSILQESRFGSDSDAVLLPALQMALLKQNAEITSLLIDRKPALVEQIDFISIYQRTNSMLFRMPELIRAFGSEEALDAEGCKTTPKTFLDVLGPWFRKYKLVPGYVTHLEILKDAKKELGFSSLIVWAVLIGNQTLARIFWQWHAEDHDPIRMALIASQTASNVARILNNESKKYEEQATMYEGWAHELLDYCRAQRDAQIVLLRRNIFWPDTIIKLAVQGEHKTFVGHRRVQMLVDDWWNGASLTRELSLPSSASTLQILLYLIFPFHDLSLQEVESLEPSANATKPVLGESAANSNFRKAEKIMIVNRFSPMLHGARKTWSSRLGHFLRRGQNKVGEIVYNSSDHVGRRWRVWRSRLTIKHMHSFLGIARVKFTFKFISYMGFLVVYVFVLSQDSGMPTVQLSVLDWVFYIWAFTLLMEELHQWNTAYLRGDSHLDDPWNVMDVLSLSILQVVFAVRVLAIVLCGDVDDAALTATDDEYTSLAAQTVAERFGQCSLIAVARVPLSLNAFLCFFRVLNWLMVWRDIGIISVILIDLYKDIQIFVVILALVVFGFSAALMGLVPALSDSVFTTSGAFFLPYWAMFGEYGDLDGLSEAALHWGPINWGAVTLWLFNFFSQVLLVNLLIAMMSERYTRIKEEADNEWRFRRVLVVDEFCCSGFALPPPLSLWYTMRIWRLCDYIKDCCCGAGASTDMDLSVDKGLLSTFLKTPQSPDHIMLAEMLDAKARALADAAEGQRLTGEIERVLTKTLENQELLIAIKQATAFSLDETSQGVGGGGLTPNAPNAVSRTGSMSMARIEESRIAELAMRMTELSTELKSSAEKASESYKMLEMVEGERQRNSLLELELERLRSTIASERANVISRKHRRARGRPRPARRLAH